jgi:hypothetical protein
MPKRLALKGKAYRALHTEVLQRDGWQCRRCKRRSSLHIHHIVFRSNGGDDATHNLVTVCENCHNCIHGVVTNEFVEILPLAGDGPPDANVGLRFLRHTKVVKRHTWKREKENQVGLP